MIWEITPQVTTVLSLQSLHGMRSRGVALFGLSEDIVYHYFIY